MTLSLSEFRAIGREHRFSPGISFLIQAFTGLFGPINIHPRIRAGHVIRTIRQIGLPEDACVLDAGCGRGLVLFWLAARHPGYKLHGIEIDAAQVSRNRAIAQKLGLASRLTFEWSDLSNIDVAEAAYDLVLSIDVLEHIVEDVQVLRLLHKAVKPDGALLLHLPLRHQNQIRIFRSFERHTVADHVRDEYLPAEILAKLEITGFEVRELRYGFGWQGELAFELNNLFWESPSLRGICTLLTYPIAWYLAYRDANTQVFQGNSLIIFACPQT